METYDPKKIESMVHENWKKEKIPEKIVSMDWKKKKFYLLDGPPYVNGVPHVGHAKTTVFKDVWGRLKYMQGHAVWFQPGFDCGGLPIENKVEQELGVKSKTEIETKIGVDKFIHACEKFAKGNEKVWLDFYKNIGAWRGWLEPYLTSENYYIESGWWTIKKWFDRGLLAEGQRPGFWCSHCETVLAGIEASESYKNVEDPSIILKLRIAKNEFLLVWTTTPWTLPANVAVLVHPEEIYVKAKVKDEIYIIAEKRLCELETLGCEYKILDKIQGKLLQGIKYEKILDVPIQSELEKNDAALRIYVSVPVMKKRVASKQLVKSSTENACDEFGHIVTMDVGTGLVHTAPGHGDADNRIGKHYNLPELSPVDEKGLFTEEAGQFSGKYVKKADKDIIEYLEDRGKLFYSGKTTHSYPLCWRCKTPLLYRMSKQWFLKIDMLREKIIAANKHVNWLPEYARERYHNTISEAPDWAITRQRYWGIPLPVWTCEKCGSRKVVGSIEELRKHAVAHVSASTDLHKNTVDRIRLRCICNSEMTREKDIMDVWFDSGIAPWASLGYPFRNKQLFESLWKIDLIDESQDQVKAWFDKLMICGFATFDEVPFKTVCLNGWTLDEKGEKMSKSLGNVVFASDAFNSLGADALRLYICSDVSPWDTQKFSLHNAQEMKRQLNIIFNCYNYFKTYCLIDENNYSVPVEDRWILSRLNNLVLEVRENSERFMFEAAVRKIINFAINDFSRTYIKLVRSRNDRELNATMTNIFKTLSKLMAPFAPFISEYIYSDMFSRSVHLQSYPKEDRKSIDNSLEEDMVLVDEIMNKLNAFRKERSLKQRWPLACLCINAAIKNRDLKDMIATLANVNEVVFEERPDLEKIELAVGEIYVDANVDVGEALLRELMREIQAMRKQHHLVVSDKIKLFLDNEKMREFEETIKEKVGAEFIEYNNIENEMGIVEHKGEYVKFKFVIVK